MLGEDWEVRNFGASGATMLKKGNKPYWKLEAFQQALDFKPDVVVIKLGTNDSKPQNWKHGEEFGDDYQSLIKRFKSLESNPDVWVCMPAPVYKDDYGINASVVDNEVLSVIKLVKKAERVKLINLYKALSKKAEMFPDGIYPNAEGAKVIAKKVAQKLKKGA